MSGDQEKILLYLRQNPQVECVNKFLFSHPYPFARDVLCKTQLDSFPTKNHNTQIFMIQNGGYCRLEYALSLAPSPTWGWPTILKSSVEAFEHRFNGYNQFLSEAANSHLTTHADLVREDVIVVLLLDLF